MGSGSTLGVGMSSADGDDSAGDGMTTGVGTGIMMDGERVKNKAGNWMEDDVSVFSVGTAWTVFSSMGVSKGGSAGALPPSSFILL